MADTADASSAPATESPAGPWTAPGQGPAPGQAVPPFTARRLLVFGTGALSVAFLPFWLNWLRITYPSTQVRVVVTRSAERFVSRAALRSLAGDEVLLDTWPDGTDSPSPSIDHVELAEWPDAVAVHPAGLHFLARFAQGSADTPVLLALQCTRATIGIAPALPPGAERGPAYRRHVEELGRYDNVLLAPPHPGRSASTGRNDASAAAPLPALLALIERHHAQRHHAQGAADERPGHA
ncbi:flavoprotein [Streptomyces sp. NPDC004752]